MRIIAIKTLRDFWEQPKYADAEQPLKAWYAEAKQASWNGPDDIKDRYAHASILKGGRVVFNIGGNKYRLVVWVNYDFKKLFIRFVGTHKEYDNINADEV